MASILSIDDDPALQDLVALVLGEHGHQVHWAFSGEDGYDKALSLKPDLILLDMMLPTLNGVEVLKLLKANETLRSIPVLVVTAYSGEGPFDASAMKALGAVEILKKPVPAGSLTALVAATLAAAKKSAPSSVKSGGS